MDSAAEYLKRFRQWVANGGKQDKPQPPAGMKPKGNGLPQGVAAAIAATQPIIYLKLTGTGACWQPGPSVLTLIQTAPGVWVGSFPGGGVGRRAIDEVRLIDDGSGLSTFEFRLNGQVVQSLGMINGIGGGAAPGCGCGQITGQTFA